MDYCNTVTVLRQLDYGLSALGQDSLVLQRRASELDH